MSRITSRRAFVPLGIAMALAVAAGVQSYAAQTAPQTLPATPQNQNRGPDQQSDRQSAAPDDQRSERGGRLERRLAFLHTRLEITPAQDPAWTAFADVVRQEARARVRGGADGRDRFRGPPGDGRRGPPSVVDRLEDRQQMLSEEGAGLDRILTALRPLYASFSPEQKRAADRMMFNPGDDRFGDRFGGRGGPGGGRGGPGFGPFDRSDPRDYRS